MAAHALLSASSSHRWLNCTGAPRLEATFPDTTSVYAQEGTLAHELCELKLKKYTTPMAKSSYTRTLNKLKKHELWQDEMEGTSDVYLDYVKEILLSYKVQPAVVIEKRVDFSAYVPEGFGTADCLILAGDTLHVIDYKHGKGVVVDADHNPQMMLYALGAMHDYSLLYMFNTIKMTIVQPRVNNISEFEMSATDLLAWGEEVVKPKAQEAYAEDGHTFEAGKWCGFCRAKQQCKARYEANDAMYAYVNTDPRLISLEDLGTFLKHGQDLEAWFKDMKEYALSQSLDGADIPGWKAVEGRGSRAFQDGDIAVKTLIDAGIDESILYERKVLTLAQIEKAIGKVEFTKLVGDQVVKNPGKPTLVVDTDKRPRITNIPSAAQVFEVQSNGGN
ncbi:DUF2800 domain-containing protein [Veillonella caviae]|uniref:DUF2800 domain-containing protein n=1 Tax=Veillonella caviae TaxID=248316 RepID=UPI0023F7910D|nr:DUF2800 domain-containing protein [Veillonella caviae]